MRNYNRVAIGTVLVITSERENFNELIVQLFFPLRSKNLIQLENEIFANKILILISPPHIPFLSSNLNAKKQNERNVVTHKWNHYTRLSIMEYPV